MRIYKDEKFRALQEYSYDNDDYDICTKDGKFQFMGEKFLLGNTDMYIDFASTKTEIESCVTELTDRIKILDDAREPEVLGHSQVVPINDESNMFSFIKVEVDKSLDYNANAKLCYGGVNSIGVIGFPKVFRLGNEFTLGSLRTILQENSIRFQILGGIKANTTNGFVYNSDGDYLFRLGTGAIESESELVIYDVDKHSIGTVKSSTPSKFQSICFKNDREEKKPIRVYATQLLSNCKESIVNIKNQLNLYLENLSRLPEIRNEIASPHIEVTFPILQDLRKYMSFLTSSSLNYFNFDDVSKLTHVNGFLSDFMSQFHFNDKSKLLRIDINENAIALCCNPMEISSSKLSRTVFVKMTGLVGSHIKVKLYYSHHTNPVMKYFNFQSFSALGSNGAVLDISGVLVSDDRIEAVEGISFDDIAGDCLELKQEEIEGRTFEACTFDMLTYEGDGGCGQALVSGQNLLPMEYCNLDHDPNPVRIIDLRQCKRGEDTWIPKADIAVVMTSQSTNDDVQLACLEGNSWKTKSVLSYGTSLIGLNSSCSIRSSQGIEYYKPNINSIVNDIEVIAQDALPFFTSIGNKIQLLETKDLITYVISGVSLLLVGLTLCCTLRNKNTHKSCHICCRRRHRRVPTEEEQDEEEGIEQRNRNAFMRTLYSLLNAPSAPTMPAHAIELE